MAVPANYRFVIAEVYSATADDIAEISADQNDKKKWADGYTSFKSAIRAHLKLQQNGRCAFCRLRVPNGITFSNLEHIVGKTKYPQFEFLPKNLVYCCHRCNFSKVTKVTLDNPDANPSVQTYPTDGTGFSIVNPYHDRYEDHIEILDGVLITTANASPKGQNTIKLYKLTRVELAEDRASEQNLLIQSINKQLLARLTDPNIDNELLSQINDVIANLPTWTL